MHLQPHHYHLSEEDELTRLLDEAKTDKQPVFLETPHDCYRMIYDAQTVNLTDAPWTNYDPEKVRAALKASAGAFRGIDTRTLKRETWEAREQDTPGRPA